MSFLYKSLLITLSLLSNTAFTEEQAPQLSLWGKVVDFTPTCSPWKLRPQVNIPALREFTVCLSLQLEVQGLNSPRWTAFMYRHPVQEYAELELGGENGRLVVWLFGKKFTTLTTPLHQDQWHELCVTWSHEKDTPALYVDRNSVDVEADLTETSPPSCCQLAPKGSLTLGAPHTLVNGNANFLPSGRLRGKVSLVRIWSRERSKEEVMSLNCTEGDVVKWEQSYWDTATCTPLLDSSPQCEWSTYKVTLTFAILRNDEKNSTESYDARDIAHRWLEKVLSTSINLQGVFVFSDTRSILEGTIITDNTQKERGVPILNRFRCLVHLNIIPRLDVAIVQDEMRRNLTHSFSDTTTNLFLISNPSSIYTTAVEGFFTDTTTTFIPVTTSTFETTTLAQTSTAFTTSPTTASPSDTTPAPSVEVTELTTITTATSTITTATTSIPNVSVSTVVSPSAEATELPTSTALTSTIATSPTSVSMLYFEVQVNVSMTGDGDPERTISSWLNTSLPGNSMTVLDLQLLPKTHRSDPDKSFNPYVKKQENCVFQVEVSMADSEPEEMERLLESLLKEVYNNGSISIATEVVLISRIIIFQCNPEIRHTLKGLFMWPDTSGGRNATLTCPKNPLRTATRHCQIRLATHWLAPDLTACPLVVEVIPDLDDVEVTTKNAKDILDMIQSLLSNKSKLNYDDLATVLNKMEAIINISVVTPPLAQAFLDVISDVLKSDSDLLPFTNTILNLTETLGDRMTGYEDSATLTAPGVAMSVVDVDLGHFSTLSFGVLSDRVGLKPEIFINKDPLDGTVAFISLPSVLQHNFPQSTENQTSPRIQFQFFGVPWLFKQNSLNGLILNTFVVSASVTNSSAPIRDLEEDVRIMLRHLTPNNLNKEVQCVYWNYNFNDGGGWDTHGCRKYNSTADYTTCLCDHLTHFGVLLDVSRTPLDPQNEYILTIITYVGCGVSSLFLGVTVLTYMAFEKLRRDYPSQILINLSLALLGLNLVFLVNSWFSSWGIYGLCIFVAAMLHYFLLASFTWMGLEAVNMYLALVKVFNVYVPSYILKFCVLGWGIPLVVCVVVLIVNREAYGSHLYTSSQLSMEPLDNSDSFCWLQNTVAFYVSVVGYAAVVFLFNTAVFIVVLIQIRRMRFNSPAGTHSGLMKDLKGVASLTLLLGLTWTIGFFTWGPTRVAMLFLFSILNSLQGLFIFIFHCLMKDNVRKQWRIHLCIGRFRLEDNSEWSNSASYGVMAKPKSNLPRAPVPSVRSVKSSSTESTSASSDSSQRESTSSSRRPDLGLFVNALVIPRAKCSVAGAGALRSDSPLKPTPGWTNHLLRQEHT